MRREASVAEMAPPRPVRGENQVARYLRVRARSEALAAPLSAEDQAAQSMPDASPVKWHLAHTSWFWEQLLLRPLPGYRPADCAYDVLFNSYYETLGPRVARHQRGLQTRPSIAEVMAYRARIDDAMLAALDAGRWAPGAPETYLFELALNHEQQHQELILTDLLHLFAQSPLAPAYVPAQSAQTPEPDAPDFIDYAPRGAELGWDGEGFAFDNEAPRHEVLLAPFQLADRAATNAEWLAFMEDGGYRRPELWMSDGWARALEEGWRAPLYWREVDGQWRSLTLGGEHPVDPGAPVVHVSWYEADAFARWSGARLPSEAEWEHAATGLPVAGNLAPDGVMRPLPAGASDGGLRQMFGDVWEWTSSPYAPYPGFETTAGVAAEYNGKFMVNQLVLRGGSFATPADHIRATYRNFFYPHHRWQFMGVRLARDLPRDRRRRAPGGTFLAELQAALAAEPKTISPKWFYDEEGSRLFEAITDLPEYYLTGQETALLRDIAPEIAARIPAGAALVEFGSGASVKTRLLLDAALQIAVYAPLDISADALAATAAVISADYPGLEVAPVACDFTQAVRLPRLTARRPLVGFFPGSTIGNLDRDEAGDFLAATRRLLGDDAWMIVGVDLSKAPEALIAAYDDVQGVTAAFNRNLLVRANRELGADFDLSAFDHEARWNAAESRVEMHLVSRREQVVTVGGRAFHFSAGETLHTENSHKHTIEGFTALAEASGWRVDERWISPAPEFAIFALSAGV
ncbi:MAG: ergothioneine biosynthesis protein EgtB [Caulobacteraceae bacterium]|jgi:dimethylhistidine N-methyltransferase